MNIFVAELTRFLARRLVRIMFLLVVIGFAVAGVVVFVKSSHAREVIQGPRPRFDFVVDDRFHLRKFRGISEGMNGLFIPLFMLLGASFMGAEWHTRSITASLTFEPRRPLLLLAKTVAACFVAFVSVFILEAVLFLFLTPAGMFRGTTSGLDGAWFADVVANVFRAGLLAAFGATFGIAIATIGRNAAAALGVGFVYFAILEQLIRQWRPNLARWLLGDNIVIVATGKMERFYSPGKTPTEAALTLLVYAAIILLAATVIFRNRDVA